MGEENPMVDVPPRVGMVYDMIPRGEHARLCARIQALEAENKAMRGQLTDALAANLAVSQGIKAIEGMAESYDEPFKSGLLTATEEIEYRFNHTDKVCLDNRWESSGITQDALRGQSARRAE